jgi:MarR family transcriptional regulator, lower aerobic nicotinate degradation pathway regulator
MDYDTAPTRLRGTPSWLLGQAAARAGRMVSQGLGAAGAHRYHYSLLSALEEFGPASQAALGRRIGIDRSDIVATVNDLAASGLIERTPDPADRRRNVITITPQGTRHLRRLDRLVGQVQDELLAPLAPSERDQLARLLTRVLEHDAHAERS